MSTQVPKIDLGSLLGLWRTRGGKFVVIDQKVEGKFHAGWKGYEVNEFGDKLRDLVYMTVNFPANPEYDLMSRRRGEESGTEDFKWPVIRDKVKG